MAARGQEKRGRSAVGDADGGDAAVRPRPRDDPVQHGRRVGGLLGRPLVGPGAERRPGAADVDVDHGVVRPPACGRPPRPAAARRARTASAGRPRASSGAARARPGVRPAPRAPRRRPRSACRPRPARRPTRGSCGEAVAHAAPGPLDRVGVDAGLEPLALAGIARAPRSRRCPALRVRTGIRRGRRRRSRRCGHRPRARRRRSRAPGRPCRAGGARSARAARARSTAATTSGTCSGRATPIVSPIEISSHPSAASSAATRATAAGATAPVVGAAERRRHVPARPHPGRERALEHRRERGQRLGDGHVHVRAREPLGGGGEDGDRVGAGRLGPLQAAQRWARAPDSGRPRGGGRRAGPASASASCGTALGETNDVTSTTGRPASARSSTKRTFSAAGTVAASFWRPSRGPTSTTVTRSALTRRRPARRAPARATRAPRRRRAPPRRRRRPAP